MDLRAWTDGDDPRHIDRNATARSGHLHVRTFHAERDRTLLLVADLRPSMLWGTRRTLRSIAAAEALCLIGWRAVGEGSRVGLLAVRSGGDAFVRPRGRDRAMVDVIGAMVQTHAAAMSEPMQPDPHLSDTLDLARRLTPRGAEVVLATALDAPGEAFADQAAALGRRSTFSVVRVVDAFETAPPGGRYPFATLSGRSGMASPDRIDVADPDGVTVVPYQVALGPEGQSFLA